jgi:hypothetical protein
MQLSPFRITSGPQGIIGLREPVQVEGFLDFVKH